MIRNIGELNRRIRIQRKKAVLDEYGDAATDAEGAPLPESWETVFVRWSNRADLSGREYFAAAAEQARSVTTFTIRWTDGVTNDMRIVCGGEIYRVEHVSGLKGAGDYMEIRAIRLEPESEGFAWQEQQ